MSRRRRTRTHDRLICYRILNNQEETEEYQHEVPFFPTEINYQGQILKVNNGDDDILRYLHHGMYGPSFIININGQSNTSMTVKQLVMSQQQNNSFVCPVDLATLESLNAKNCPYILAYYGAASDKFGVLHLYMEPMDTTMEKFSVTAHSLDNLAHIIEWKHLLYRCIHNVASGLNFLRINGVYNRISDPSAISVNRQGYFKLHDICISIKDKVCGAPFLGLICDYNYTAEMLEQKGYHIQPEMWVFGLTLFEILVGENPFCRFTTFGLFASISEWMPVFPSNLTDLEEIQQLITRLLQRDQEQQLRSYAEILEIPFIKNINEPASQPELDFISRIIDKIPSETA